MPEFGDVIYNISGMYVAALQSDNTFGEPAFVEYGQDYSWDYEADTDEIMSYGQIVETLAIIKKATGTMKEASLNMASKSIMTGTSESESGTSPNKIATIDFQTGGAGLPYFGIIVAGSSVAGNVLAGFPKCKLQTIPSFKIEQNKFRLGEAKVDMLPPSSLIRKVSRIRRNETAASIPTTGAGFDAFFAGMFD